MTSTLTLSIPKSVYISLPLIFIYKSYSVTTPKHSKPLLLENYVYIVALAPDLRKVSVYCGTEFLYYSFTTKPFLLLILIKGSYPSFRGLTTMLDIVMSLVAAVARRFMQGRHLARYLGSKQLTILVSAKQPRTSLSTIPPPPALYVGGDIIAQGYTAFLTAF